MSNHITYYDESLFDYHESKPLRNDKNEKIEYLNPSYFDYSKQTEEDEIRKLLTKHCKDVNFIEQYMKVYNMNDEEIRKLMKQHKQNVKNNKKYEKKMKKKNRKI